MQAFPESILVLSSGIVLSLFLVSLVTALPRGAVKYAARIRDVQDPWGMPDLTGLRFSLFLSRQIEACHSCMKLNTHLAMGRGMQKSLSVLMRCRCRMES